MAAKTTDTSGLVPKTPELTEVATSGDGRDITKLYAGALEYNADTVLAARGGGLELYEEVLRDNQCFATFQQRRLAVIDKPWEVVPGAPDRASRKAADQLRETLDAIDFDRASNLMLYGLWYGYAVGEIMWARDGAHVAIDAIKVRRARRFRYGRDGSLRLLTMGDMHDGEPMPPAKFWTFTSGAQDDDNPYGLGLGHWCYWPAFFKRHDLKFWLMFLDKFGAPTTKGEYPPGTTQEDIARLLAAAEAIKSDSAVVIPEGMMLELIEASRSGTTSYEALYDRMDAAISKVVLSQTMTTDDGSSRSQGEVHLDVRNEVIKSDADLLTGSFNCGPAAWMAAWNFPGATPPKVWRLVDPPEDLKEIAERDRIIYDMGFKPTLDYIRATYGEGWEEDPQRRSAAAGPAAPGVTGPALPTSAPLAFADPPTADAVRAAADGLDDRWEELLGPVIEPLRDTIGRAGSVEDIRDALIGALDDMDPAALTEHLARLGFAARLSGETGAPLTGDETADDDPAPDDRGA